MRSAPIASQTHPAQTLHRPGRPEGKLQDAKRSPSVSTIRGSATTSPSEVTSTTESGNKIGNAMPGGRNNRSAGARTSSASRTAEPRSAIRSGNLMLRVPAPSSENPRLNTARYGAIRKNVSIISIGMVAISTRRPPRRGSHEAARSPFASVPRHSPDTAPARRANLRRLALRKHRLSPPFLPAR